MRVRPVLSLLVAVAVAPMLVLPWAAQAGLPQSAAWQSTPENDCQFTSWYAESGGTLHPGTLTAGVKEYCGKATTLLVDLSVTDGANTTVWTGEQYTDSDTHLLLTVALPAPTVGHVYTIDAIAGSASGCPGVGECRLPPPPPVQPHEGHRAKPIYALECQSMHPDPEIDESCEYSFELAGTGAPVS